MRIVCWNMQHKRASWRFLRERHAYADVALLQEACTPPPEVATALDVGPGPWTHRGWKGARAVVRLSDEIGIERVPVADIIAAASPRSAIDTPARLGVAICTLPDGERLGLVSVETGSEAAVRVPRMISEVREYCGADLPYIVGGDLTTWPDGESTVFADMLRIGLPLVGPHAPTFYSPLHGQSPADARLQLDYVFVSRSIAHRVSVDAINAPGDWGPSDHCRIRIDVIESRPRDSEGPATPAAAAS